MIISGTLTFHTRRRFSLIKIIILDPFLDNSKFKTDCGFFLRYQVDKASILSYFGHAPNNNEIKENLKIVSFSKIEKNRDNNNP